MCIHSRISRQLNGGDHITEGFKRGKIKVKTSSDGEKVLEIVTEAFGEETTDLFSFEEIMNFINLQEERQAFRTVAEKIDFIYDYLKIGNAIKELGRFTGIYAQFSDHISEEVKELRSGNVKGPEYFRRLRLVQFALSMALVYARVRGDTRKIPEIEKLWKDSIRLG